MIGPFDTDGKKRPRAMSESEPVNSNNNAVPSSSSKKQKTKKSKKDDSIPSDALDGNDNALVSRSSGEDEVPLGKRLEQLSRQMAALEQQQDQEVTKNANNKNGPSADSLVTLLDQALQSGDAALLEQCLNYTDLDIIDTTTKLLSTHRVLKLLKVLVAKFEKRPSRGLLVTRWMSCILKNHLSYLITVPDLSAQLAGLNQMLEQRLQAYTRLSSLAGRLDLLMSQISSKKGAGQSDNNQVGGMQPKAVYQD